MSSVSDISPDHREYGLFSLAPAVNDNADEIEFASPSRPAIRAAWAAALGKNPIADDLSWKANGGDSLSIVNFLFRLEEILSRQIPLDVLSLNMTVSSLTVEIDRLMITETVDGHAVHVFVAQALGVEGGPSISTKSFIRTLDGRADVTVLDYESVDILAAGTAAFDAIVVSFYQRILRLAEAGKTIVLVGHSFGGCVLYEVSRRLEKLGLPPAKLLIVDATVDAAHHHFHLNGFAALCRSSLRLQSDVEPQKAVLNYCLSLLLQNLAIFKRQRTLNALGNLASLMALNAWWNRRLKQAFMRIGRSCYKPGRYGGDMIVLCGSHRGFKQGDQAIALGWNRHAAALDIVEFQSSGHGDPLGAPGVQSYMRRVLTNLQTGKQLATQAA